LRRFELLSSFLNISKLLQNTKSIDNKI